MNCHEAQTHWDDARDRTLEPDLQAAFEQHLRQCARCRELYQRESQLLATLGDDPSARDVDAVTDRVMRQVQQDAVDPVIMKLAPWAAMAAAVALVVSVWATWSTTQPAIDPETKVATHSATPTHPVSILMQDVTGGIDQPQRLRDTIAETTTLLDLSRLAGLLENQTTPGESEPANSRG